MRGWVVWAATLAVVLLLNGIVWACDRSARRWQPSVIGSAI